MYADNVNQGVSLLILRDPQLRTTQKGFAEETRTLPLSSPLS
jgi:hypothetical protein